MHNHIDIDYVQSRAIVREIGEKLRASLKPEPEIPANLRTQIDRLRELEEQSPSIVPDAEHWKTIAVEPQMGRPNMDEQCHR
jgi:hypothetical protein